MSTQSTERGVSGVVAALLASGTLLVGLFCGLVLGAAGGYLLGQRISTTAETATLDLSALGRADDTSGRGPASESAPPAAEAHPDVPEMPEMPALPGLPGMPGAAIIGAEQPFLGVEVSSPDPAASLAGARIESVEPDTAADSAGLAPGDVVVAFDGAPIATAEDLALAVRGSNAGDTVTLRIVRDDEELTLTAELGSRPGVIPFEPGSGDLEDLLEQLPPEMQERFREMLEAQREDQDA